MAISSIKLLPGTVSGTAVVPASKSLCHRAILCAALSDGVSQIRNITWSKDIEATAYAAQRLGADIRQESNCLWIRGIGGKNLNGRVERLFCGESASTVRFLIPVCGALGLRAVFSGLGRLNERPLDVYYDVMDAHGFRYERESAAQLPVALRSRWTGGLYQVPGHISSQFVSGLLMALPLAEQDSVLEISTRLESLSHYVDLTLSVLKAFGIRIENQNYRRFIIPGGQTFHPTSFTVEGDYSQAAAFLAAGACAGEPEGLTLYGLDPFSLQGDKEILSLLKEMKAETEWLSDGGLRIYPAEELTNIVMDAQHCPDLVPVMAALAAFGRGTMRIIHAQRLRLKESDRLKTTAEQLKKCGVSIEETEDGLIIFGQPDGLYEGGEADSCQDHRLAMALSIIALRSFGGIELTGWQSVAKSWPSYWKDYAAIGGEVDG